MSVNLHYKKDIEVSKGESGVNVKYELVYLCRLPEFDQTDGVNSALNLLVDWNRLDEDACGTFSVNSDTYKEVMANLREITGEEAEEAKSIADDLESLREQVEKDGFLEIESY